MPSAKPRRAINQRLATLADFNARNRATRSRAAVADTLELKLEAIPDLETALATIPPDLTPYVDHDQIIRPSDAL